MDKARSALRRRTMAVTSVAAIALAACGSEPTREEAVEEFVSVGFTEETAECVVDDLQRQGFEVGDLTGDIGADVEDGISVAVENCLSTGDLGGIIGNSDELRQEFVDGIVESGAVDAAQAECVVARLEADGAELAEVFARDDFDAQITEAVSGCL